MIEKPWQDLDGLKVRPHTVGPDDRGPLPEGMVQLAMVKVLRERFGGQDWRRVSESKQQVPFGWETSITWRNEYGVRVEVMT